MNLLESGIVSVSEYKTVSGFKVSFNRRMIFQVLREQLGFRYCEIPDLGRYFLRKDDEFRKCTRHDIVLAFLAWLKEETSKLDDPQIGKAIRNAFYGLDLFKSHVRVAQGILGNGFILSDAEIHSLRMRYDRSYFKLNENNALINFMSKSGFEEALDKCGNWQRKKPFFFKRLTKSTFTVINVPFGKKIEERTYDLWKVNVNSKEALFKRLPENANEDIRLGLHFYRDKELLVETLNTI